MHVGDVDFAGLSNGMRMCLTNVNVTKIIEICKYYVACCFVSHKDRIYKSRVCLSVSNKTHLNIIPFNPPPPLPNRTLLARSITVYSRNCLKRGRLQVQ